MVHAAVFHKGDTAAAAASGVVNVVIIIDGFERLGVRLAAAAAAPAAVFYYYYRAPAKKWIARTRARPTHDAVF